MPAAGDYLFLSLRDHLLFHIGLRSVVEPRRTPGRNVLKEEVHGPRRIRDSHGYIVPDRYRSSPFKFS